MVGSAVLKKQKAILSKVKSKYWEITHKYGIEVPRSVKQAKEIDQRINNTLWWDVIVDEMATVRIAFMVCEDGKIPPGYQKINCHLIFDVTKSAICCWRPHDRNNIFHHLFISCLKGFSANLSVDSRTEWP